jgi:hypothetical protein
MFQPRQVPSPGGVEKSESKKNYESEKKKNERKKKARVPAIDSITTNSSFLLRGREKTKKKKNKTGLLTLGGSVVASKSTPFNKN